MTTELYHVKGCVAMTTKEREELRKELYDRDGHKCNYCGIHEDKFIPIWGYFKRKKPPCTSADGKGGEGVGYPQPWELIPSCRTIRGKGKRLEIDHKNNHIMSDSLENCVLACAICNNAKSNKFTYEEFKKVGKVIKQIWNERESQLRKKGALT